MKHWKTTEPAAVARGTGAMVRAAADAALQRMNGGVPPNLQMAPRGVLLRVIRDQNAELARLRAGQR